MRLGPLLALLALLALGAGCRSGQAQAPPVVEGRGPGHPVSVRVAYTRGLHNQDRRDAFRLDVPREFLNALPGADRAAVEGLLRPSTQARCEALQQLESSSAAPALLPWVIALLGDDAPSWQDPRNALIPLPTVGDVAGRLLRRVGPEAVPALLTAVADTRVPVNGRVRAIQTLGSIQDERMLPPLLGMLAHDPQPGPRQASATALAGAPPGRVVPALIAALSDADPWVRHDAAEALRRRKAREAVPALIKALGQPPTEVQCRVATALGDIGDPAAVPHLLPLVTSTDPQVPFHALQALDMIGDPRGIAAAASVLGQERLRGPALLALGQMHSRKHLPLMLQALRSDQQWLRYYACGALGGVGGAQARQALEGALADGELQVSEEAARALGLTGPDAIPALLRATAPGTAGMVRYRAIEALGGLRARQAVPLLVQLLSDPEVMVASGAATALGEIGDPSTVGALRQVCDGTSRTARYTNSRPAMLALARFGPQVALPVLLPLARQQDEEVRRNALRALAEVAGPEAEAALVNALRDPRDFVRDGARRGLLRRAGWSEVHFEPW